MERGGECRERDQGIEGEGRIERERKDRERERRNKRRTRGNRENRENRTTYEVVGDRLSKRVCDVFFSSSLELQSLVDDSRCVEEVQRVEFPLFSLG